MDYIKLHITETGRNCLKDQPAIFNDLTETFKTVEKAKDFLTDRYGQMPKGKNKIYIDTNNEVKVLGFTHSFWNKDWSHNSKSWYQTDWIEITNVNEVPVLLN